MVTSSGVAVVLIWILAAVGGFFSVRSARRRRKGKRDPGNCSRKNPTK